MMKRVTFLVAFLAHCLAGCSAIVPVTEARSTPAPRSAQAEPEPIKPSASTPVAPKAVAPVIGDNARKLGVVPGPAFATFRISEADAKRGIIAFRLSCPALLRRQDLSGLTRQSDWTSACANAAKASDGQALRFFEENFDVVQVGDGKSFATGYFEPEILGSRTRTEKFKYPVYSKPPELVELDLGQFSEGLKGKKIRGKVQGNTFVPYADRTEIEEGVLEGRGLEIAWVADPVDFFFLQVQGSGRLRLPNGAVMRIGYDGQNGRDYTGIGKLMRERGLLAPGQATMQGISSWLRNNPEEARKIMRENRSWVFFREITGPGPLGALNVPVVARASVAADPMFVPLGAPIILSMDRQEPTGLWVAQDTGGAIKGSNRFDTYWGGGEEAAVLAGGMSAKGTAFLLLPKVSMARLVQEGGSEGSSTQ